VHGAWNAPLVAIDSAASRTVAIEATPEVEASER